MPFSTIIITANMVSRASTGLPLPVSMTAEIISTSIAITAMVRTSVPKGSPIRCARLSAWRTIDAELATMTQNSQPNISANHAPPDRSASQAVP